MITYESLTKIAEPLTRDDFDPRRFLTDRGIMPSDVVQVAVEVAFVAAAPDTLEGRAAVFVQGFQLGTLVAEEQA